MTTIKTTGCGGRYSIYQFIPCSKCPCRKSESDCNDVLRRAGYQGRHEEWWKVR